MISTSTPLSPEIASQKKQLAERGFFIERALLTADDCASIRQALHQEAERLSEQSCFNDALLEMSALQEPKKVPLHERFRKLSQLYTVEDVWNLWLANPKVLACVQNFLGQNILNKFASAFLKPARTGGPTPWHQDIALWNDQNSGAMNAWLAIDPATKSNGCLQMLPGSHKGPVIPHLSYENSVHGELPRERCQNLDVEHIELMPGDVVFWHSHLWHYSPPNTSDHARMGCGAVWINPDQIQDCHPSRSFHWAMRDGLSEQFPSTVRKPDNSHKATHTAQDIY